MIQRLAASTARVLPYLERRAPFTGNTPKRFAQIAIVLRMSQCTRTFIPQRSSIAGADSVKVDGQVASPMRLLAGYVFLTSWATCLRAYPRFHRIRCSRRSGCPTDRKSRHLVHTLSLVCPINAASSRWLSQSMCTNLHERCGKYVAKGTMTKGTVVVSRGVYVKCGCAA